MRGVEMKKYSKYEKDIKEKMLVNIEKRKGETEVQGEVERNKNKKKGGVVTRRKVDHLNKKRKLCYREM